MGNEGHKRVTPRAGTAEDKRRVMQQYKYPGEEPDVRVGTRAAGQGAERADENKQGAEVWKKRFDSRDLRQIKVPANQKCITGHSRSAEILRDVQLSG